MTRSAGPAKNPPAFDVARRWSGRLAFRSWSRSLELMAVDLLVGETADEAQWPEHLNAFLRPKPRFLDGLVQVVSAM